MRAPLWRRPTGEVDWFGSIIDLLLGVLCVVVLMLAFFLIGNW